MVWQAATRLTRIIPCHVIARYEATASRLCTRDEVAASLPLLAMTFQ